MRAVIILVAIAIILIFVAGFLRGGARDAGESVFGLLQKLIDLAWKLALLAAAVVLLINLRG